MNNNNLSNENAVCCALTINHQSDYEVYFPPISFLFFPFFLFNLVLPLIFQQILKKETIQKAKYLRKKKYIDFSGTFF